MPNKTRLRKVMSTINTLAKGASDDAVWNQESWWDGDDYVVTENKELLALDSKWNRSERKWEWNPRTVGGEGIKCNASGCFAGWAVALFAPPGTQVIETVVHLPDGTNSHIDSYAQELLGLDEDQSGQLFSGYNSLGDLKSLVKEFTA